MKNKIELGDKVKCKITGFTGIATARSEFINGCVQYSVLPKIGKEGMYPGVEEIDEESLEVVLSKAKKIEKSETGGPSKIGVKRKCF